VLQLDRHRPSPGVPELNRRIPVLVALTGIAFLVMIGRLWQLQVVRGERYFQRSTNNFIQTRWIEPVRGKILDRRHETLVDNRPANNVYVTPRYFTQDSQDRLARLMGLNEAQLSDMKAKVARAREKDRFASLLLYEDVTWDQLALIKQAEFDLPGVEVRDAPHRNYLHGTLAAHLLGYMNQIHTSELEERRKDGYEEGDYVGRSGLEKQWESYLRGKKGYERYVVDARGVRQYGAEAEALITQDKHEKAAPGHTLILTIDAPLQRIAERALRNHPAGGIAVVDVKSGRILALVSKPAFDPNVMTGHLTRAEEAQLEADPYKPFIDKTLRQHYYPGSTYKFVTAIAGLLDGVNPEEKVTCKGWHELGRRTFRCMKAHGAVNMREAMSQSCNVYFWHVAERVGMDKLARVARDFGFGAPTGLGLNGDVPGRVPWKSWYEKRDGFRIGYTLNTAIGQGDTEVTVLQLALAYAAVANGGDLWVPQLVERVETAGGDLVVDYPPALRRKLDVSPAVLAVVREGLWGVVNDPKGTAYSVRSEGVVVAGKTGTAQVRKLSRQPDAEWHPFRDHAWFAGYAPADDPQIAVVVLVEHGGKGGHVAAPIAMDIIHEYLDGTRTAPVEQPEVQP
jgi:penicillin-binding protein 2